MKAIAHYPRPSERCDHDSFPNGSYCDIIIGGDITGGLIGEVKCL